MITKEYALAEAFSVSASTMSGAITGVQARLKMFNPRILYTHCFNHVLNLCLVDTVIVVDNARHFFDLLQAIYVFISRSAVHIKFMEFQKEDSKTRYAIQLKNNMKQGELVVLYLLKQFFHLFQQLFKH